MESFCYLEEVHMTYIASIDVGTTNVKGALITQGGGIQASCQVEIDTFYDNDYVEQNPEQWWGALKEITKTWRRAGFHFKDIAMISLCGQMQDVIPIDKSGAPVRNAILYSDIRAGDQATRILEVSKGIESLTGNEFNAATPFAKIKWLGENEPSNVARTASFLFSSKDFLVTHLTGKSVTDVTTAATSGMMSMEKRAWLKSLINRENISIQQLPDLKEPDAIAGYVTPFASECTGFVAGTPVLCGQGDAGATTLGAGVVRPGDRYIYVGTTGWIATTTNDISTGSTGIFQLAHLSEQFIKVIPLTNVGSAHEWAVQTLCREFMDKEVAYTTFENMVRSTIPVDNGALFLPYLNNERFPVHVSKSAGTFLRLSAVTTSSHLARAVMEGIAFSIRMSLETLTAPQDKPITLLGGGTRSKALAQIMADVCQRELHVPENAENLPILGAAAAGFIRLGWCRTYQEFAENILIPMPKKRYIPNSDYRAVYDQLYADFKRIYPAVKDI